jgi:hypothetical protein
MVKWSNATLQLPLTTGPYIAANGALTLVSNRFRNVLYHISNKGKSADPINCTNATATVVVKSTIVHLTVQKTVSTSVNPNVLNVTANDRLSIS